MKWLATLTTLGLLGLALPAQAQGPTLVPAALRNIAPAGAVRGETVRFTFDGVNVKDASRVVFDDPAITGTPAPGGSRNQAVVTAVIGAGARVGVHRAYLVTPLGTTGSITFYVGAWPQIAEKEPNDTAPRMETAALPATFTGSLGSIGDVDHFSFGARAGEELVFEVVASAVRSRLASVLTLLDASGKVLAESQASAGRPDALLGYKFGAEGVYTIRIRDFENASGGDVTYRLNVGPFSHADSVFPLGFRRGEGTVRLQGFNLGDEPVKVVGDQAGWGASATIRETPKGPLVSPVRVAVGEEPEVLEGDGPNDTPAAAQSVTAPVTINGRIAANGKPDHDYFRFTARKGQKLLLEVQARRLGSPLDSVIEVLDAAGTKVERATLRCVAETAMTLNDRDSATGALRLLAWNDLAINDFIYVRGEVIQIRQLPLGPDEDVRFRTFRGQRTTFLDTTASGHAVNTPVYKVQIHPPGRQFPPNGMPVFRLYHVNDDGGPLYGKDSRLTFVPPADGEYVVRIGDVRGQQSERHAYRLTIREPRPDFRLSLSPEHPNVPVGSSVPVAVSIDRLDGFDGPVEVRLEGLPEGITATSTVIEASEADASFLLTAAAGAKPGPTDCPLRVVGRAQSDTGEIVRTLEPDGGRRVVTVLPRADLTLTTKQPKITIAPGTQQYIDVAITRENGFAGRVPVDVKNLPFGVRILDVGLNGVLITESGTSRRFALWCEPWVQPLRRTVYATVRTETESPASTEVGTPLLLEVLPAAGAVQAAK